MGDLRSFLRVQQRFVLLVALCAVFMAGAGFFFVRSLIKPDTGLLGYYPEIEVEGNRVVYSPSAPFSPAMASGLLPGRDALVSVNGVAIAGSRDLVRALSTVTRFQPVPIVVRRDGTTLMTIAIEPSFVPTRIEWAFVLVFCLALAAVAITLSLRLPQGPGIPAVVMSALVTLVFTCVKPFAYESVGANLVFNLGNVGAWLLVVFAMYFPQARGTSIFRASVLSLVLAAYAVFSAVRVGLYTRWMEGGLESALSAYKLVGQIGNISDGIAYAVLAVLLVTAYSKAATLRDKTTLQWFIAGLLLSLPPYFFLDQLPLVIGGPAARVGLGPLAQLFLSILPIFLLIGLTRYRAFDFRLFLNRFALYAMLFVLMIAAFAMIFLPLRAALERGYTVGSPLPELFAAGTILIALAVLRIPLERLLSRWSPRAPRDFAKAVVCGSTLPGSFHQQVVGQSPQARRLAEARAFARGFAGAVREPIRQLTMQVPRDREQGEAAARVTGLLLALDSLPGSPYTIRGSSTADFLVRRAIQRARDRHPAAEYQVVGSCTARLTCHVEELAHAVSCVLENAAESQETGAPPVVVGAWSDSERLCIDITDHGLGIDGRARRRLYSPFFTTKPGHYGIGLFFARLIVERNEGTMGIEPGETSGTRVRLSFRHAETGGAGEGT